MANDLTTRLLAEIERREGDLRQDRTQMLVAGREWYTDAALAYLAALREVVELHTPKPVQGDESRLYCPTEDYDICAWPCPTIMAVARALGVEP